MIEQIIALLKQEQHKLAVDTIKLCKPESYQLHAGKYQGLQEALDIIDQVIKGFEED